MLFKEIVDARTHARTHERTDRSQKLTIVTLYSCELKETKKISKHLVA